MPGSTVQRARLTSKSMTRVRYFEQSTTSDWPTVCPACEVLPRGGGTSQAGQTVGQSLVVDCSKYLTRVIDFDVKRARCTVEPGIVLDDLNRQLKPHGLWFPVDISTSS